MTREQSKNTKRETYRHGDLYQALLEAGVELARDGGPDAVVLREVTRRAGVVPNAAYRHFADRAALLNAVCDRAMAALAVTIEKEIAAIERTGDQALHARRMLRAVGNGYVGFALAEPGLFRTAFSVPADLQTAASPSKAGNSGMTPFQLLSAALDMLAEAGVLPPEKRMGAEFLAWSAVHGLAVLALDGPLRGLDADQKNAITRRLLIMVEDGL